MRQHQPERTEWRPRVFKPCNPADKASISELMTHRKGCQIHDTIVDQLRDLAAIRHPCRKLTNDELSNAVTELLGDGAPK